MLASIDRFLSLFRTFRRKKPKDIPVPQKILLSNGAHLGDVLLSTGILRLLREIFPDIKIGFLAASWSHHILVDHPLLDHLHTVDHWKLSRSRASLREKVLHYMRTKDVAEIEIKNIGYDVAVDLYPYFPNNIPLIHRTGIPVRIGYTSGGFGPLLTHSLEWINSDRSILLYQKDLVGTFFPIQNKSFSPWIFPDTPHSQMILSDLADKFPLRDPYVVFHMGAGSAIKEWPLSRWKALAVFFSDLPYRIVMTGVGDREKDNIGAVIGENGDRILSLCDRLGWNEFVSVVQGATIVISADSVAGHIAAATGTPCVVIGTGQNVKTLWHPFSERAQVLVHPVHCAPCYRSQGCEGMECIRETSPREVFDATMELLRTKLS